MNKILIILIIFNPQNLKIFFLRNHIVFFVAVCERCLHNTSLHAKNYFSSTNCFCFGKNKRFLCSYCTYLKPELNQLVIKICVYGVNKASFNKTCTNRKVFLSRYKSRGRYRGDAAGNRALFLSK